MTATPLPAGSLRATSLNAGRRAHDLQRLASGEIVDVLVVGGGVTGAGAALDAASRGLSVALVEAHDLAFGTSRWSSKLVHGGLRYLATGDVALAYESAVERGTLLTRTAPHLVRALPQLMPLTEAVSRRGAAALAAALRAGDVLRRVARTGSDELPAPRRVSAAEALALVPGLRRSGLRAGLLSFDGQLVDDAALVVALARTAAGYGARMLTRVRAEALGGDGAAVVDGLTGQRFDVRARSVINATGVWAARLVDTVRLRPSRGSHLVLDAAAAGITGTALFVPVPGRPNRFVFLLPQLDGRAYLGLTDEPFDGPVPDVPAVPDSDIDFLLGTASTVLAAPLTRAHVVGSFAGLRPLLAGKPAGRSASRSTGRSADLSRRHAVLRPPGGPVTVVGGKLTTYRRMAAAAVDAAVAAAGLPAGPSRTCGIPLTGAAPRHTLDGLAAPPRLVARYGTEALRIVSLIDIEPDLGRPVAPGLPVTAAEVLWAVRHEGALDAGDVLDRRTRIGLVPADRAAAEPAVTALLADTLPRQPF
ncbi:MAG TPA: glycerol-3-phosphate dehydrogenase/oxidase [Pseudonocardiaceae bacterium]|nr:glycerol-3-phosphate dehydrogenase/oxidase [Pseudonocardiaceae bacterium]